MLACGFALRQVLHPPRHDATDLSALPLLAAPRLCNGMARTRGD